ncbi:Kinesin-like protein KIN-4C (AtKINESIN-4C) [Durusdinium trenchii]|uniref:Kinesin-like protein KIN-4C (AtKINESIN-4C) n=1 Tax=Durusdinium trenchii TaxID=1381693 RepID=A0ABP0JQ25_9DINO
MSETSVRVSVRIRPLMGKEKMERCSECVKPLSQTELVMMGKEKQFTFDNVFGKGSCQQDIYKTNVAPLVDSLFDGYNATVLAYGQTGSGKTYTMGTSTDSIVDTDESKLGMIPRAMGQIFEVIEEKKEANPGAEFYLRVQFLEVYGEDIRDLLDPAGAAEGKTVSIREGDKGEGVQVVNAVEESVKSTPEMLHALERGALCRTTGSTQMNVHSSRSHAIFTIIIEQHLPITEDGGGGDQDGAGEDAAEATPESSSDEDNVEFRTAKFHFVDLAGSERAKRTGATGTRLKEGININKGLLALGNVISALGDETRPKGTHVPYRDSKLTRMLQDSLGGNSRTLMIACVSPADANFEETLNALRYANRARNIKNKPVVNRDPNSSQIATLKAQIAQLKLQLSGDGKDAGAFAMSLSSGFGSGSGFFDSGEAASLRQELEHTKMRAESSENELQKVSEKLEREKRQRSELQEKYIMAAAQVEFYTKRDEDAGVVLSDEDRAARAKAIGLSAGNLRHVEELQDQLRESDAELNRVRRELDTLRAELNFGDSLDDVEREIVRNARVRKSLGMHMGGGADEDDEGDEPLSPGSGEVVTDIDSLVVPELSDEAAAEITEDDDEVTKELKEKFQQTQTEFRKMVHSYDVTLKSKQLAMRQIVDERKKFEAMKAQYEAKMAEMNAEVLDTQQQRDNLDTRIKDLEKKKSDDSIKAQLTRLRLQLKDKNERLKALETQSKQLQEAKRNVSKWEAKEKKIQREIDLMKKQKVDYQRRMEENAKKYREESQQRKVEIARLRKQSRVLAQDKKKLEMRNTRDERLLRQKTEQVTSMQRKLRQAQRLTVHNKKLTDKERKQRKQLEEWAKQKMKKDDEIDLLQRSLAKQKAAMAKKEKLVRELEERKRAAEHRAKVAEESAAKTIKDHKKAQRASNKKENGKVSATVDTPESSTSTTTAASTEREKADISEFFTGIPSSTSGGSAAKQDASTDDESDDHDDAAIQELEEQLEAADLEYAFHTKQTEAAAAKIEEDDDTSKTKLPQEFKSVDEATTAAEGAMNMYMKASRECKRLQEQVAALKRKMKEETRSRREMHRRKSLLSSETVVAGSPNLMSTPHAGNKRRSLGGAVSPSANPAMHTPANPSRQGDPAAETNQMVEKVYHINKELMALLKANGIAPPAELEKRALLLEMEAQLKQQQVVSSAARKDGSSRRSSLSGFPGSVTPPGPSRKSLLDRTREDHHQAAEEEPLVRTPGVFDRLSNTQNFTGIHKRKVIDGHQKPRHGLATVTSGQGVGEVADDSNAPGAEQTVDSLVLNPNVEVTLDSLQVNKMPEVAVDGMTLNPSAVADIERKRNQHLADASPRNSVSPTNRGPRSPSAAGRRTSSGSNSPSFTRMTESSKRRVSKSRESTGSTSSTSSGVANSQRPAFCSATGPVTRSAAAKAGASVLNDASGAEIKTETGTYKPEGDGLYRNNAAANTRGNGRARQAAWEARKQTKGGDTTGDGPGGDGSARGLNTSTSSSEDDPEKENTADDAVPIHEKLADPANFTGTQKQKVLEVGLPTDAPDANQHHSKLSPSAAAAAAKQQTGVKDSKILRRTMAQERARRKKAQS